jgi:flavin reductase (DIM6/NTAB) family NADH-FMN oxidoreductase RutF
MKEYINLWEYAQQITEAVSKGVLLTTQADGEVNSMTISWGLVGIQWHKPIFVTFVRQSRHTKELLDKNPEFTINVPVEVPAKEILGVCGRESGRDVDKIEKLGLQTVEGDTVDVPAIVELPLTLECKVIYRQDQDLALLRDDCRERYYKPGTANENDFHTAYYGEITAAYIVKD